MGKAKDFSDTTDVALARFAYVVQSERRRINEHKIKKLKASRYFLAQ